MASRRGLSPPLGASRRTDATSRASAILTLLLGTVAFALLFTALLRPTWTRALTLPDDEREPRTVG